MKLILLMCALVITLLSCAKNRKEKAFKAFNEGVSLNLEAISAFEKGNIESALSLNKESIDKFKETIQIDSSHTGAPSALGHSLYMDKQYGEAIYWFNRSNKVSHEMGSTVYREMGLCKINLGNIKEGKVDLNKSIDLDTTKQSKEMLVLDLIDIGTLAFSYGEEYDKQPDIEKGIAYKKFAIAVLALAFEYDRSNKDIALKIAGFAEKINDKIIAEKFRKLSEL